MVTVALYAFIFSWNEFLAALSYLTGADTATLPVALSNLQTGAFGTVDVGILQAGAVLSVVPCLAVFFCLQRYYVRGLTSGAVKV
jgi:multiple sugar transport system permease protein